MRRNTSRGLNGDQVLVRIICSASRNRNDSQLSFGNWQTIQRIASTEAGVPLFTSCGTIPSRKCANDSNGPTKCA